MKDISLIVFDMEILKNFEIFFMEFPFFVMLNLILNIGGNIWNSRSGIAENPIPLLPGKHPWTVEFLINPQGGTTLHISHQGGT